LCLQWLNKEDDEDPNEEHEKEEQTRRGRRAKRKKKRKTHIPLCRVFAIRVLCSYHLDVNLPELFHLEHAVDPFHSGTAGNGDVRYISSPLTWILRSILTKVYQSSFLVHLYSFRRQFYPLNT
jgi:hypothetical protein